MIAAFDFHDAIKMLLGNPEMIPGINILWLWLNPLL